MCVRRKDTFYSVNLCVYDERQAQKGLECVGYQIVIYFHKFKNQVEVAKNQWVTVYQTTVDKVKALKYIKKRMGVEMKWSM